MEEDSEGLVPEAQSGAEKEPFWRRWVGGLKKLLQWVQKQLKKLHEWLKQSPLLVACLWAITGALVAFGVLWVFIGFAMHGFWTWGLGPGDTTRTDAVRTVLTMIAGVGGIVALTIAYRRQRGTEAASFMNQLENAARMLGSTDPTVQFAGIYALAALADESADGRKQQCIDVLCGYMRLPYQGGGKPSMLREVVEKHVRHYSQDSIEETRTHLLRPSDREVRLTIIQIMAEHLQKDAPISWSHLNFNFTGVVFDGGDFSGAVFSGEKVSFAEAQFSGGMVSFAETKFSGGMVFFNGAKFSGGMVFFNGAKFSGGTVSFDGARFNGGTVSFIGVQFKDGMVSFDGAQFNGGMVSFFGAKFSGGTVSFNGAKFSGGTVSFDGAQFNDGMVSFIGVQFKDGMVSFFGVQFSGGTVSFFGAQFSGGTVSFNGAKFSGGEVSFDRARFSDGDVSFDSARFSGGEVSFSTAEFNGGNVDFRDPMSWDTPPLVPWGDGQTPVGVRPDLWPPTVPESSQPNSS